MDMELWAVELTRPLTEKEEADLLSLMPPERRERALRIRERERRREPLCAYMLLRYALYEKLGWKELPEIGLESMGKPFFPQFPTVHFNLSHTRGAVLVGLHDRPLGVDIERIRPVSQRAVQRLAGVATEKAFFESWVRREARAKRSGSGVGMLLGAETELMPGEHFYFVETFQGFVAGVATKSLDPPGKVRRFSLDDLVK
ncbi:4'-phosphopantetheinyl transferase [Oscillibacter sp. MSJ-2]|uniref:4'-phosphopantetheinyl transferase n=2 Tax=Dysosmobacter acutus TaxID=2841504 RepID=A0ABS6FBZ8_9FIRM|nr:4'-phosphopantetheinyl transferase [Dysosmobacter acutus]